MQYIHIAQFINLLIDLFPHTDLKLAILRDCKTETLQTKQNLILRK